MIFRYGTDGIRLAVEVVDRFGRLKRSDLVRSLRRAQSGQVNRCLLYTSDAADERSSVDLGGRRIIKKKKKERQGVSSQ